MSHMVRKNQTVSLSIHPRQYLLSLRYSFGLSLLPILELGNAGLDSFHVPQEILFGASQVGVAVKHFVSYDK